MPIIYIDVLVVLNWMIDYLLLSLTARLTTSPPHRLRMVAASFFGGLAACQIVLTIPTLISVVLHIATAAIMIRIAFPYRSLKIYLRSGFVFLCMSALLSGLVTALWYFTGTDAVLTHNGVIYCEISPLLLVIFSLVGYGVICLYDRLTHHRSPKTLEYVVTIDDGCGVCECRALYDTGLHLRDPFSGIPVIVVQRKALQPYISKELVTVPPSPRLRMIPYHTVGGTGLLPAFVPRSVTVRSRGNPPHDITGVYVALSDEQRGEYTALIGADVLDL